MNRAERRREDRIRVRKGDNIVVTSLGQRVAVDDVTMDDLPVKRVGEHRFTTMVMFSTPRPGAAGPKLLNDANMVFVSTGCVDCEEPWSSELEAQRCPAGDTWTRA